MQTLFISHNHCVSHSYVMFIVYFLGHLHRIADYLVTLIWFVSFVSIAGYVVGISPLLRAKEPSLAHPEQRVEFKNNNGKQEQQ